MNALIPTAMRAAFEAATANVPREKRTAVYAMVRSAMNRKIGVNTRRVMWSVQRGRR